MVLHCLILETRKTDSILTVRIFSFKELSYDVLNLMLELTYITVSWCSLKNPKLQKIKQCKAISHPTEKKKAKLNISVFSTGLKVHKFSISVLIIRSYLLSKWLFSTFGNCILSFKPTIFYFSSWSNRGLTDLKRLMQLPKLPNV